MKDSIRNALAPGTVKNRKHQAEMYIKFMIVYGFNYLEPEVTDLSMYYQFLGNTFSSPATVKNHLSGAKNWVLLHGGNVTNFSAQEIGMISKSILENSGHAPSPADPITPADIKQICLYIDLIPDPHPAFKAAILLAFATFLRVSNVLSPSRTSWGGAHTLMAQDLCLYHGTLLVTIRSTKTRRNGQHHVLTVAPVPDARFCPINAWLQYYYQIKPCPLGPAFMLNDNTPLTPGPVVNLMRKVLRKPGDKKRSKILFHSLRRGGAQAAAEMGATQEQIMEHGTWKSQAGVEAYPKKDHSG